MPTATNTLPRLDAEAAIAELGGMRALYVEALAIFLVEAPRQQTILCHALAVDDAKTAGRAAHSLKAMAAALGAQRLSALALATETACREGRPSDAATDALAAELDALAADLRAFAATRPAG